MGWRTLLVVPAVLVIAACDSTTGGRGTAAVDRTAGRGPALGSTIPDSSGPAPTATPAPTPPPTPTLPPAADGTNLAACADARCEVSVRGGAVLPVPASTRVRDVRVMAVTADRVRFTARGIGNSSSSVCLGRECDSSSVNGAINVTLGADSRVIQNGLSITVERIANGRAVLKLEPAT